jgi:hypothetical protein
MQSIRRTRYKFRSYRPLSVHLADLPLWAIRAPTTLEIVDLMVGRPKNSIKCDLQYLFKFYLFTDTSNRMLLNSLEISRLQSSHSPCHIFYLGGHIPLSVMKLPALPGHLNIGNSIAVSSVLYEASVL